MEQMTCAQALKFEENFSAERQTRQTRRCGALDTAAQCTGSGLRCSASASTPPLGLWITLSTHLQLADLQCSVWERGVVTTEHADLWYRSHVTRTWQAFFPCSC